MPPAGVPPPGGMPPMGVMPPGAGMPPDPLYGYFSTVAGVVCCVVWELVEKVTTSIALVYCFRKSVEAKAEHRQ